MSSGSSLPPGIICIIIGVGMAIAPDRLGFQPPSAYAWGALSAFALGVFLVCLSVRHIIALVVGILALIAFVISSWNIFGPLFQ